MTAVFVWLCAVPDRYRARAEACVVLFSSRMDRVVKLTSFEEQDASDAYLEYWLSRPAEERIEEVDRLRLEFAALSNISLNGFSEGLPRSLRLVERGED